MAVPATLQPHLQHSIPVILLLLTAPATICVCHHPRPLDATFSWDSLQLLQTMAPSPTQPCQLQQAPTLPRALLHNSHPQQGPTIALRILQHLFAIFSSPGSPQHWDTRARDELLNNLHHHIHRLEQCLPANGMLSKRKTPRKLRLSVDKYFRSIQEFLHTQNHSTCAWDHVRLQARACFQHMDRLIRQMKSQDALHQPDPHQTSIAHQHQRSQSTWQQQQPHLGLLSITHTSSIQEVMSTEKRT